MIHFQNRLLIPIILTMMVISCIIDISIIRISPFIGDLSSVWNLIAFLSLVIVFAVGQYIILDFIKEKIDIGKIYPINTIHKSVLIAQCITITILIVIVMQMLFTFSYTLLLLKIIVIISCGLSIVLLAFLAKKFFTWFRMHQDTIVIIYAVAILILIVNLFSLAVFVIGQLNNYEDQTRYTRYNVIGVTNANNIFNTAYVVSSVFSFIMLWVATVLLLRYHSKKLGSAKYWIIVTAPLFYFLSQFQVLFFNLFDYFAIFDPTLFAIVFTLVFTMSQPIGGILFGVTFWIVSRQVNRYAIKDYLIVSGFGMILLFTSNQVTSLILNPYPPFGIVTAALIGLSSYLLLVGIYSSAMSISRDIELRKFIHTITNREIQLLGNIGFAQAEQELLTKVLPAAQHKAQKIEQETGITPSLTDVDIKDYLEEILNEVRNAKQT